MTSLSNHGGFYQCNSGVTKPLNIIIALPESDFLKSLYHAVSHHTIKNLGFAEKLKKLSHGSRTDSDLVIIDDCLLR